MNISQDDLNRMNVEQARLENKNHFERLGGLDGLIRLMDISLERGLTSAQVSRSREKFGQNKFPVTLSGICISIITYCCCN